MPDAPSPIIVPAEVCPVRVEAAAQRATVSAAQRDVIVT